MKFFKAFSFLCLTVVVASAADECDKKTDCEACTAACKPCITTDKKLSVCLAKDGVCANTKIGDVVFADMDTSDCDQSKPLTYFPKLTDKATCEADKKKWCTSKAKTEKACVKADTCEAVGLVTPHTVVDCSTAGDCKACTDTCKPCADSSKKLGVCKKLAENCEEVKLGDKSFADFTAQCNDATSLAMNYHPDKKDKATCETAKHKWCVDAETKTVGACVTTESCDKVGMVVPEKRDCTTAENCKACTDNCGTCVLESLATCVDGGECANVKYNGKSFEKSTKECKTGREVVMNFDPALTTKEACKNAVKMWCVDMETGKIGACVTTTCSQVGMLQGSDPLPDADTTSSTKSPTEAPTASTDGAVTISVCSVLAASFWTCQV